jgi:hypothetical protein
VETTFCPVSHIIVFDAYDFSHITSLCIQNFLYILLYLFTCFFVSFLNVKTFHNSKWHNHLAFCCTKVETLGHSVVHPSLHLNCRKIHLMPFLEYAVRDKLKT